MDAATDTFKDACSLVQDGEPILVKNAFHWYPSMASRPEFLRRFGNGTMVVSHDLEAQSRTGTKAKPETMKISEWVNTWDEPNATRYAFSWKTDERTKDLSSALWGRFKIPPMVRCMSLLPFFTLGGKSAGIRMHMHGPTWVALLSGRKRWYVKASNMFESISQNLFSQYGSTVPEQYFQSRHFQSCDQQPSEMVVLPHSWWHATFDVEAWTMSMGAQLDDVEWPLTDLEYAVAMGNLSSVERTSLEKTGVDPSTVNLKRLFQIAHMGENKDITEMIQQMILNAGGEKLLTALKAQVLKSTSGSGYVKYPGSGGPGGMPSSAMPGGVAGGMPNGMPYPGSSGPGGMAGGMPGGMAGGMPSGIPYPGPGGLPGGMPGGMPNGMSGGGGLPGDMSGGMTGEMPGSMPRVMPSNKRSPGSAGAVPRGMSDSAEVHKLELERMKRLYLREGKEREEKREKNSGKGSEEEAQPLVSGSADSGPREPKIAVASPVSSSDLGTPEPKAAIDAAAPASDSDSQAPKTKVAVRALHTATLSCEINALHFLVFAVSVFSIWVGVKAVVSLWTGLKAVVTLLGRGGRRYAVVIGVVSITVALASHAYDSFKVLPLTNSPVQPQMVGRQAFSVDEHERNTVARHARCDFEVLDARDKDFQARLDSTLTSPMLIINLIDDWRALKDWKSPTWYKQLVKAWEQRMQSPMAVYPWNLTALTPTNGKPADAASYFEMWNARGDNGLLLEPNNNALIFEVGVSEQQLKYDAPTPEILSSASSGDARHLAFGALGTGHGFHRHNEAWQAQVVGYKSWYMLPGHMHSQPHDETVAPAPFGFPHEDSLKNANTVCGYKPSIQKVKKHIHFCVQGPSEVVYIPNSWWHATCSLDDYTVAAGGGLWWKNVPNKFMKLCGVGSSAC